MRTGVDLFHAAVSDVDLRGALPGALDACPVFILFVGRVDRVEHTTDRAANDVLRQLGAVLGPVGFEHTCVRIGLLYFESNARPELDQHWPRFLGRQVDREPALIALPFNLRYRTHRHDRGAGGDRSSPRALPLARRGDRLRAIRHQETLIARQLRQVGRNFQRLARLCGFVLHLVRLEDAAGPGAARKQRRCQRSHYRCDIARAI